MMTSTIVSFDAASSSGICYLIPGPIARSNGGHQRCLVADASGFSCSCARMEGPSTTNVRTSASTGVGDVVVT